MRYLIPFLIAFIFASTSPCQGLEIQLQPYAKVTTHSVTLADIAEFNEVSALAASLGSQIIVQSPAPGKTITIDALALKNSLVSKLSLSPNILWKGPAKIQIDREGKEVVATDILSYIQTFIDSHREDLPKAEIKFIPHKLPLPFLLPLGEMEIDVLPSSPSILKSASFSLIFKVNGRVRKNLSVSGRIEALAPVAIATTIIKKGSILSPGLVQMKVYDIAKLRTPSLALHEIIGKRSKRTIKSGTPIELSYIEFPPVIKKGQLVKIILKNGALQLSATGIAKMNGTMNQIIRVQNNSSKKTIFCRVAAPGLVEVTL